MATASTASTSESTQTAPASRVVRIKAQPLTPEAFAPYGTVVSADRAALKQQEGNFTARLMAVKRYPERVTRINRHLDHTQLFIPLAGERTVLVVAPPDVPMEGFDPTRIAAFVTDGRTATIFHRGTWHIEPRARDREQIHVINVQTDVSREHTELIHLEEDLGVRVELEV